MTDSMLLK